MRKQGFYGRCAHCGIEVRWEPVRVNGKIYCWQGCAEGEPVPKVSSRIMQLVQSPDKGAMHMMH